MPVAGNASLAGYRALPVAARLTGNAGLAGCRWGNYKHACDTVACAAALAIAIATSADDAVAAAVAAAAATTAAPAAAPAAAAAARGDVCYLLSWCMLFAFVGCLLSDFVGRCKVF